MQGKGQESTLGVGEAFRLGNIWDCTLLTWAPPIPMLPRLGDAAVPEAGSLC